jgi:hypothetical protein
MSFTLTSLFEDDFEYAGKIYNVNMTFDNILLLYEMFDDESLMDIEKIDIAIDMLVKEYDELKFNNVDEMVNLFKYIMREFLDIDLDKVQEEQEQQDESENKDLDGEESKPKKYMSYTKDAGLIFASFFAAYKIDLFEMHGKLHWKKFVALLSHLEDNTKFKQVIGYRTAKIPTGQHVDKDQVEHIKKMKKIYALEDTEQTPQEMSNKLNNFAEAMKQRAKIKK